MGPTESRGWSVAVGILAVVFGIVVFAWPGATSLAILYVFAAWANVSGVADIAHAFMSGLSGRQRVWLVIIGLLGIAAVAAPAPAAPLVTRPRRGPLSLRPPQRPRRRARRPGAP
jgi:uncharacterized membrane protein HdeD (DUF308 family)